MHPLDMTVMLALLASIPLLLRFCAQAGLVSRRAKALRRPKAPSASRAEPRL